jgi:hypothetical protein
MKISSAFRTGMWILGGLGGRRLYAPERTTVLSIPPTPLMVEDLGRAALLGEEFEMVSLFMSRNALQDGDGGWMEWLRL